MSTQESLIANTDQLQVSKLSTVPCKKKKNKQTHKYVASNLLIKVSLVCGYKHKYVEDSLIKCPFS